MKGQRYTLYYTRQQLTSDCTVSLRTTFGTVSLLVFASFPLLAYCYEPSARYSATACIRRNRACGNQDKLRVVDRGKVQIQTET